MTVEARVGASGIERLQGPLPEEFRRFHWGAFFFNWVWGLGNGIWVALLAVPPWLVLGRIWEKLAFPFDWIVCTGLVLAGPILLGRHGYALAWRNRSWRSVDEFRHVQRAWSRWGMILVLGWFVLMAIVAGIVVYALRSSSAYEAGVRRLQESREVAEILGSPVEVGRFPLGRIHVEHGRGSASLTFPVIGPKGRGRALVEATKRSQTWTLDRVSLEIEGREGSIDVPRRIEQRADVTTRGIGSS